jgi:hypothetical protein
VIRRFRPTDLARLKEIHAKAGYGFEFPEVSSLFMARVIEDSEGNVVGLAGAQLEAQIFGIFDPDWGTPGERMVVFTSLHRPILEKLDEKGAKDAYVAIDPKFRGFGRRLMRLGWKKALWTQYFLPVQEGLRLFGGRMAS